MISATSLSLLPPFGRVGQRFFLPFYFASLLYASLPCRCGHTGSKTSINVWTKALNSRMSLSCPFFFFRGESQREVVCPVCWWTDPVSLTSSLGSPSDLLPEVLLLQPAQLLQGFCAAAATPVYAHKCLHIRLRSAATFLSHLILISLFHLSPRSQHRRGISHSPPPASSSASLRFASSVRARRQRCCCPRLLRGVVSERRGWQERFGKRQIKVNKRSGICRETAVVFNTVRVFSPANIVPVTFCTNLSDSWAKAPFDWLDYSLVENN